MDYSIRRSLQILEAAGIKKNSQNIRYAIKKGKLKSNNQEGKVFIPDYELDKYIKSQAKAGNDTMYFDTNQEKIDAAKTLLADMVGNIEKFAQSFQHLSCSLDHDYVLDRIMSIALAHNQASSDQLITKLHEDISILDAEENPLTLQIQKTGRIPNLAAISTLPDFTHVQMDLIHSLVESVRNAYHNQYPIKGEWLINTKGKYQIDNVLLDNYLLQKFSLVVNDKKEQACFLAYDELINHVNHFVNTLDKIGVQRPHFMANGGIYPLDKLVFLKSKSDSVSSNPSNFLDFIRTGFPHPTGESSIPLSDQRTIDPSEIKAGKPPVLVLSPSFRVMDIPKKESTINQ
ncbi:MAG: hypothetical protein JXR07_11920 [Reichenbachiella sp.]